MSFLRSAARAYLLSRLARGARRQPRYARYGAFGPRARRRGHRRQSGFRMWGPFPSYSRRTRGGSRVTVGGCCLPLPLVALAVLIGLTRAVGRL